MVGKDDENKKQRLRQEAQVLQDFMIVTQRKVEQLAASSTQTAKDLNLSEGEKRLLNKLHSAGMMEGLIAGVATFVVLRRIPRYLNRVAARRAAQQQQHSSGMPPPSSSSTPGGRGGYVLDQPGKINSPFQKSAEEQAFQNINNKGGFLWRTFQLSLDLSLSFVVAAYTSYYMADVDQLNKSITEIPLMEGRSAISDNFCGILVQEYQRQWKLDPNHPEIDTTSNTTTMDNGNSSDSTLDKFRDSTRKPLPPFDRKEILKNPQQLKMLKGYTAFIENCKKRQAVERRIRQERGLGPNDSVEIPPPGINATTTSSSGEWSSDDDDDDGDNFSDSGFYSGETQLSGSGDDGDWTKDDVSSFVTDQEDSRK